MKKGDYVTIINCTPASGAYHVEGKARLMCPDPDAENRWMVRFGDGTPPVSRFVDEAAQDDPHEYVSELNVWPTPRH